MRLKKLIEVGVNDRIRLPNMARISLTRSQGKYKKVD